MLSVSILRLGGDPLSAEERFHRLSILGAHAVVDKDVEGGVSVGRNLHQPGKHEDRVLVAMSRVHLWHEELHDPAWKHLKMYKVTGRLPPGNLPPVKLPLENCPLKSCPTKNLPPEVCTVIGKLRDR